MTSTDPHSAKPPSTGRPKVARAWATLGRRGWLLWLLTFVVMLSLTAAVPVLYWALLESYAASGPTREQAYLAIVGLAGLVLLFCLYTALKQHELENTRTALAREEMEKEDIRVRLSELSELFQVSTTLNLQLRLDVILEIIVRRVVCTLRAQQASIMIYNPESGMLQTRASHGLESEY